MFDAYIWLNKFSAFLLLRVFLLIILFILNLWVKSIKFLALTILFIILVIGLEETKLIIKILYNALFFLPLSNVAKYITEHSNITFIHNLDKVKDIKNKYGSVVFISNYPSTLLEYPMYSLFDSYMIVSGNIASRMPFFIDSSRIIPMGKKGFKYLKSKLQELVLDKKDSAFCYWDKCGKDTQRKHLYDVGKERTGIFHICKELQIPIVPVVIDRIITYNGFIIKQNFRIKVGYAHIINDIKKFTNNLNKYYLKCFKIFATNKYPYNGYGLFKD